jgi:hypothetical protein
MARLVMLEIADNDVADKFVEAVKEARVLYGIERLEAKVEAVWAAPTMFCECEDYIGKSAASSKFRWWVHAKCGKPRRTAQQLPRNLMEPSELPRGERVYYIGFMADRSAAWNLHYPRPKQ